MRSIGRARGFLEPYEAEFVVEALAKNIGRESVRAVLKETGRESLRRRCLPAEFMVWFVILMGLKRRASYTNILEKLDDTWWTRKHWSSAAPPTSSSVTKARDRLGIEPMELLFGRCAAQWMKATEGKYVDGRRVRAFDGTTMKVADTAENVEYFGYPGASRGSAAYPQMRVVALEDVGSRMTTALRFGPYSHGEMTLARELVPEIPRHSILLMDRNFFAYDFLWDIHQRGERFVVRQKSNIKPQVIERLGPGDELVEVAIPAYFRKRRPDMPRKWVLRRITYRVEGVDEEFQLLTNLMDTKRVKKEQISELYHDRWEEETMLDEIKTHLCECATVNRPVVFRSKKPQRVVQELYGLLIAYNVIRKTMADAGKTVCRSPRRLSFTASVERIREAVWDMMRDQPEELPRRYARLLKVIARAKVPLRPGRRYPRAVKIKMSGYPLKRRLHVA